MTMWRMLRLWLFLLVILVGLCVAQKRCGRTKRACKKAGGNCQAKKDDCNGELLEGKKYCSKNKKCGCCVQQLTGPPPCTATRVLGGVSCNYYHREYATYTDKGYKCAIHGDDEKGQCGIHLGHETNEWCYIKEAEDRYVRMFCGDSCPLHTHAFEQFAWKHICHSCENWGDALRFTVDNRGNDASISQNNVFRPFDERMDIKIDWAFKDQVAQDVSKVCRILYPVASWLCTRHHNWQWLYLPNYGWYRTQWTCTQSYQICTGVGYLAANSNNGHLLYKELPSLCRNL